MWNKLLIIVRAAAGAGRLLFNVRPIILGFIHVSRVSIGHVSRLTVHVYTVVTVHKPVSDYTGLLAPWRLLVIS